MEKTGRAIRLVLRSLDEEESFSVGWRHSLDVFCNGEISFDFPLQLIQRVCSELKVNVII
jgi:hypothetical protein